MSAVVASSEDINFDGIRRYRTRCKIRIDSHNAGAGQVVEPMWLSEAVLSVQSSKTVKGIGQCSIALTPSNNWLNLIFPNDYINVYFDIDDGQGWTRTFFGFVDRIEETYQVDAEGKPQTRYHIVCSDFQKAFERTMIYFNPHLAGRSDFAASAFAAPNIGGLALATQGIEVGGSPSDIVQNVILITMGFGSQFHLPPSYNPAGQNRLRRRRAEFVQGQLSEAAREAIERSGGTFDQLREEVLEETQGLVSDTAGQFGSEEERIQALARATGLPVSEIESSINNEALAEVLADRRIRELLAPSNRSAGRTAGSFTEGALNILEGTSSQAESYLLDVVDTFTFVERRAIDGFAAGRPVWQQQGSLLSILRSLSHEAMNELFFDLRPLSADSDGAIAAEPVQGQYSRAEDDASGNVSDTGGVTGISYVPAVVMREYPFSTIDGLDLREVNLSLRTQDGNPTVGIVFFGAIFSDAPNTPGRHIVSMPNINVSDRAAGGDSLAQDAIKHLDVAVVDETEITRTQFGRSDAEHFNLFEFYSDALLGQDQRFYMHDLLPIVTPIHITRHGLRVRTVTTRFARYNLATVERTNAPVAAATVEEETAPGEEAEPFQEVVSPGNVVVPCTSGDGARFRNAGFARHGYREKPNIPPGFWVMHQGIDIVANPSTHQGQEIGLQIPIQCIADGEVVISAPEGVWGGYGDLVVVKHRFEGVEGPRYSVYAHLSSRAVGWFLERDSGTTRERPTFAAEGAPGVARTRQTPIRIRKGAAIGTMGNTGTSRSFRNPSNRRNPFGGIHLHFEIDKRFPPRNDNVTPRIPLAGNPTRPSPPAGFDRSFDPVDFFQSVHSFDLVNGINSGSSITQAESDDGSEPDDDDRAEPVFASDENVPREDVLEENNAEPLPEVDFQEIIRGAVDETITRSQIIRWALLQDHWYQHNLEYLSGRLDMRGAPEIRVGYRLDLPQRNMSFYIEGVNHAWQYPDKMTTSLTVTRGQPNNPYPHYVLPKVESFNPTDSQRKTSRSRLATYFLTPDVLAVRRSTILNGTSFIGHRFTNTLTAAQDGGVNQIDNTAQDENGVDETYDEHLIPANSREAGSALAQEEAATAAVAADLDDELGISNQRLDAPSDLDPSALIVDTGTGVA